MQKWLLPFFSIIGAILLSQCVRTEKIQDGETAYDRKYYSQATTLLEQEYESVKDDQTKGYKAYLLGKTYKNMGKMRDAATWFKKSYDAYPSDKTLEQYAYVMKMLGQYDQAILVYENLSKTSDRSKNLGEIAIARNAKTWMASPNPKFEVKQLSLANAASQYVSDLLPGDKLIVTYNQVPEDDKFYPWTGETFYKVGTKNGGSGEIKEFDEFPVDSKYNVSDLVVYDSIAFYTVCGDDLITYDIYCKIFYRTNDNGYWSEPNEIDFMESNRNYFHPSYDPVKKILYFSSNQGIDSVQYDLYAMRYIGDEDEPWTEPVPLQELNANTTNEMYPHVYGDTMFYSSDNTSMGGLDIYMTTFDGKRWSPPQNLKAPINSPGDDFGLVLDVYSPGPRKFSGYFSSSRNDNFTDNLYQFGPNRNYDETQDTTDQIIATEDKSGPDSLELKIVTYERIFNNPSDPNSGTREIVGMTGVKTVVDASPYVDTTMVSGYAGNMKLEIPADLPSLEVTASKKDYLAVQKFVDLTELQKSGSNIIELILEPIMYNQEIVLENIYFDYDKYDIRPDARPTLDSLATLLKINPTINIELASHTDCHGTIGYNMNLSNRRAYSTRQYLVEKGISEDRMTAVGYGESQPRVNCDCDSCTPAQDQMNRRTSFKILNR